ncbi:MAG: redoxin domain-containing protein [Sedimentisphaerales bacterium]|nr:redoxin domain-containing protein [Sedimentisphaerales bacterium]
MKKVSMTIFCIFSLATYIQAEQADSHIIHFPNDKAVGRLLIRNANSDENYNLIDSWELLSQAMGDINIPEGKEAKLEVYEESTDFSFISNLGSNDIQALSLRRTILLDEDFVYFKNLTGLIAMDICSTNQVHGSGFAHLTNFKSLKQLNCDNSSISDAALEHISKISSLERLTFALSQIKGPGLVHLKNLTSLKELSIPKTSITDDSLMYIKDIISLKRLALYDTQIGDNGLAALENMTSLERLTLGINDREIDVNSPITDAGLIHLSKLTKLNYLTLHRTCITDEGLKHLSSLSNLENLCLNQTKITGKGFAYLNKNAPLKGLELRNTVLNGAGLSNLKPWSNTLENLVIVGAKIYDEDLAYLSDLKKLKYINLSSTSISDAGLKNISNIKSLESLYLDNTKITDAGLMLLKDLPNLRKIMVSHTLVTNTGIDTFKKESASKSLQANTAQRAYGTRQGGVRTVSVAIKQPEAKPQPLIGKSIPDMDVIKINKDFEQTKDKNILFCFFEIEQRPARNSILELNKKAAELNNKGIEIIAVQASTIEQNTLDEWIKENNISFQIGMIKENAEQTQFNWGVKALPWLILTDKEHIVQAEGFSIGELDEKIN